MSDQPEEDVDDSAAPTRPGLPVDPMRILRALFQRWRLIASVALVSIVIGVVLAKTVAPKTFTSRIVIAWEPTQTQSRQDFATLIDSMLIPVNLQEVKRRMKLKVPLETLALWIQVFSDAQSDVVSLEASAGTAQEAAQLADTVVAVFLDHSQRVKRARSESSLQEVRTNLDVARATLSSAQETYDTFRRENNITDVSAETTLAIQEAAGLRSQAELARGEAQAEAARARLLEENARHQSSMVVTGQVQQNPNATALAAVRSELQEANTRLSSDHPRIAALEAQAAALQDSAASDQQTTVSTGQNTQLVALKASISASTSARAAALERQQSYAEHAAAARERLQQLSAVEGQAAVLLSEVTNASSHVTDLEGQVAPLEAALRTTKAEFRILAPAEVPPYASSGKGKLFAAGIPGASLMLCVLILVGIELRGFRVHTAREAAFWLGGPAVGVSMWPRVPEALNELLDEVSDCAQVAPGNTLIVGASPGDERAAMEITEGLKQRVQAALAVNQGNEPGTASRALFGRSTDQRTTLAEIAAPSALVVTAPRTETAVPRLQSWESSQNAVTLRRASRLSDRVIVVVTSNTLSMARLATLRTRLGRPNGIGVLVVGVDSSLVDLPDRVGDVDGFWYTTVYEDV